MDIGKDAPADDETRTAGRGPTITDRPSSDLTTRARIRDAAIACFAESGSKATFRTIATRAGVSPGLITHHFGTKTRLRAECDDEVLRRYRGLKSGSIADPLAAMSRILAAPDASGVLVVYMLRALQAGGTPARRFLDSLTDQVRAIMAECLAAGLVRPSHDEDARARYLAEEGLGALLVKFLVDPGRTPQEFLASLRTSDGDTFLPMLELYTEGVFTDRSLLDAYAAHLWRGRPDDTPTTTGRDDGREGPEREEAQS